MSKGIWQEVNILDLYAYGLNGKKRKSRYYIHGHAEFGITFPGITSHVDRNAASRADSE